MLVTNERFTKASIRATEGEERIRLMTLTELRSSVIMDTDVLKSRLHRYRAERISSHFIDLGLSPVDSDTGVRDDLPRSITQIIRFLAQPRPVALAIFADYGAGKTTTIDKVWAELTSHVLEGDFHLIPLIFRLKDLRSFQVFNDYILATVQRELGSRIDIDTFWEWVAQSRFALLLDGFDEIMVQPTKSERANYLMQVGTLFLSNAPSILSTRPSYFADRDEYERLIKRALEAGGVFVTSQVRLTAGSHGPVVKSARSTSSRFSPCSAAVCK